jgi:hypothetical protein
MMVSEFSVFDAIGVHREWQIRLRGYIRGIAIEKLDPQEVACDDRCALGKRLHGPAFAHFRNDPNFLRLIRGRNKFHHFVSEIVTKVHENDRTGAENLLKFEFSLAFVKVIADLLKLDKMLKQLKREGVLSKVDE